MSKTIVIIGATGAVGRCLAREQRQHGFKVVAAVRDTQKAAKLGELTGCDIQEVDATNWESMEQVFTYSYDTYNRIDGVAVCVGSILLKPAHLTKPDEFETILQQNLIPCMATLRGCVRPMMKGGGSIVFVSSAVAKHGFPNHEAIAAAKSGVEGLARSAAASYANYGIRVNCVAPGLVKSGISQGITTNPQALKTSEKMHPIGRIGQAEEVASAINWLLSSEQSWVTGQVIGVDGGLGSLKSKNS